MNRLQLLLLKLGEECAEVTKVASKCSQFGMDESLKELTNKERLHQELDDILAAIDMLNDEGLGYVPNKANILAKKDKVEHYIKYSQELGMVDVDKEEE